MKVWNKVVFGRIKWRKEEVLEAIQRWEKKEEDEGVLELKSVARREKME